MTCIRQKNSLATDNGMVMIVKGVTAPCLRLELVDRAILNMTSP